MDWKDEPVAVMFSVTKGDLWDAVFGCPLETAYSHWERINVKDDRATVWANDVLGGVVVRRKHITPEHLARAFSAVLAEKEPQCCDPFPSVLSQWDYCCADTVLQYLLFGRRVF